MLIAVLQFLGFFGEQSFRLFTCRNITNKTAKNGYEFMEGYLTRLRDRVRSAIKEGADMNTITQKVDMSEYKNAAIYDEVNGKNILKAYELFEME